MLRTFLKSKIHRATVTEANLDYEGSVTIDSALLELADICVNEQVHIYDVTNGNRLITYAIPGAPGSGILCINGAGAHLVRPGDLVIICSYAHLEASEIATHVPKVILTDGQNRPTGQAPPRGTRAD